MGIIAKQGFRNIIISYFGVVLGYLNWGLLLPNILGAQYFGFLKVFYDNATLLSRFASLGIVNALVKYFPHFEDRKKGHEGILTFTILVSVGGMLVLSLLLWLAKDFAIERLDDDSGLLTRYYYWLLPLTFFALLFEILLMYSAAILKTVVPTFIRDIVMRLLVLVFIGGYVWLSFGFNVFLVLFIAVYAILTLCIGAYVKYLKQLFLTSPVQLFKNEILGEMIRFSLFTLVLRSMGMLSRSIDQWMLLYFLNDFSFTGIYGVAFLMSNTIEIPRRSISQIGNPVIARAWVENDLETIESIYKKSSINLLAFAGLLFCGIWVNRENIFYFLDTEFRTGMLALFFLGVSKLIYLSAGLVQSIILNSKYYRFIVGSTFVFVLASVSTNAMFIPMVGIEGAAIATAISVFVLEFLNVSYVYYKFRMQPFSYKTLILITLITSLLLIDYFFLPELPNVYINIVFKSGFALLFYLVPVIYFNLSEEIITKVRNLLDEFVKPLFKK